MAGTARPTKAKMLFSVLRIAQNMIFCYIFVKYCYFLLKPASNSDKQVRSIIEKAHIGHIGTILVETNGRLLSVYNVAYNLIGISRLWFQKGRTVINMDKYSERDRLC